MADCYDSATFVHNVQKCDERTQEVAETVREFLSNGVGLCERSLSNEELGFRNSFFRRGDFLFVDKVKWDAFC